MGVGVVGERQCVSANVCVYVSMCVCLSANAMANRRINGYNRREAGNGF